MIDGQWFRLLVFELEQAGFFAYILPFLIITIILIGLLWKLELFANPLIDTTLAVLFALTIVSWQPFIQGRFAAFLGGMFRSIAVFLVFGVVLFLIDALLAGGRLRRLFVTSPWAAAAVGCIVLVLFVWFGGLELLVGRYGEAMVWDAVADFSLVLVIIGIVLGGYLVLSA